MCMSFNDDPYLLWANFNLELFHHQHRVLPQSLAPVSYHTWHGCTSAVLHRNALAIVPAIVPVSHPTACGVLCGGQRGLYPMKLAKFLNSELRLADVFVESYSVAHANRLMHPITSHSSILAAVSRSLFLVVSIALWYNYIKLNVLLC